MGGSGASRSVIRDAKLSLLAAGPSRDSSLTACFLRFAV